MLGANDGIISTASLIVGVAAAAAKQNDVLVAGVAGLVAGAMSMAAGEYVSVSSQSDTEKADLARERRELRDDPQAEQDELAEIYVKRGVDRETAQQVARQLMARDPLAAHARDELGISEITTARPVQAALTSAVMFSVGAAMPLLMVVVSPVNLLVPIVSAASVTEIQKPVRSWSQAIAFYLGAVCSCCFNSFLSALFVSRLSFLFSFEGIIVC